MKRIVRILLNKSVLELTRSVTRFSLPVLIKTFHPRAESIKQIVCYHSAAPDASKLININPSDVDYLAAPRQYKFPDVSKYGTYILDGDWDQQYSTEKLFFLGTWEGLETEEDFSLIEFSNYVFYNSAKEHFNEGVSWECTEIYDYFTNKLKKEHVGDRYSTNQQVITRLQELDRLYHKMADKGYLKQNELEDQTDVPLDESNRLLLEPWQNEIMVSIGRDGEIFFNEGRHRFIVAKLLGLDSIPVRVLVRHKQWQELRYKIAKEHDDTLPQPLNKYLSHPDIQDIV